MDRDEQTSCRGVFGQFEMLHKFPASGISGDSEIACGIFASGGAHGVHKQLVPFVEESVLVTVVCGVRAPAPVSVMDFVEAFENQKITGVDKPFCNLCPYFADFVFNFKVFGYVCGCAFEIEPEAVAARAVMMDVDDYVKPCIFGIAYNFGHSFETIIDFVVRCCSDMPDPCHRQAHSLDAGSLDLVEEFLSQRIVAVTEFVGNTVFVGIHLVAGIPSQTQPVSYFMYGSLSKGRLIDGQSLGLVTGFDCHLCRSAVTVVFINGDIEAID